MKNNILVLSLLLISSILCIEKKDFDLTIGDKIKCTIQKDGVYKFYAKANFAQNATIAFYTHSIMYLFMNIQIDMMKLLIIRKIYQ